MALAGLLWRTQPPSTPPPAAEEAPVAGAESAAAPEAAGEPASPSGTGKYNLLEIAETMPEGPLRQMLRATFQADLAGKAGQLNCLIQGFLREPLRMGPVYWFDRKKPTDSRELQATIFARKIYDAALREDAAWIARHMDYPLKVDFEIRGKRDKTITVEDRKTFQGILQKRFAGGLVRQIKEELANEELRWVPYNFMIGNGLVHFWGNEYDSMKILAFGHFAHQ